MGNNAKKRDGVTFSIYLKDASLYEKIKEIAGNDERTVSSYISLLIKKDVEKQMAKN